MGTCWSNRIKSVSPFHTGSNSNSRDVNNLSGSSSISIPQIPLSEDEILQLSNLKSFEYEELRTATRNFRPDSVLGEGGFGSVFKGWIDQNTLGATKPGTGMVIAVKRLNQEGLQGHREWLAEINYLGQLHHPNLVRLIGYCLEDEHRLLVYEFMPRGSLENHLFRRESISILIEACFSRPSLKCNCSTKSNIGTGGSHFAPLSWSIRMKVALGAAKGLAFLHNAETSVIYRDFKTSNILLDLNYNAKLSDFGLARDGPTGDNSHVSTRVMGTKGYAAPEYLATGHLSPKSDIYSFGVVFLEMLSGRQAIDKNRPVGEHKLVEWARPYMANKRKMLHILDMRLQGQYSLGQAQKAIDLAHQCLAGESKYRPNMDEVVTALEQLQHSKVISKSTQKEHQLNGRGNANINPSNIRSAGKASAIATSYPRPSASLLYVKA